MNTCPVCWYRNLPYPPSDYHICPCCGTEFGNDDNVSTWDELRENWIANGMQWFFERPPRTWNAEVQLLNAGYGVKFGASSVRQTSGEIGFKESIAKFG